MLRCRCARRSATGTRLVTPTRGVPDHIRFSADGTFPAEILRETRESGPKLALNTQSVRGTILNCGQLAPCNGICITAPAVILMQ